MSFDDPKNWEIRGNSVHWVGHKRKQKAPAFQINPATFVVDAPQGNVMCSECNGKIFKLYHCDGVWTANCLECNTMLLIANTKRWG